jgi:hypothetical protein
MELTPRSIRSPSPYTSNPQPLYEYPSPQSDSRFRSTDSLPGLGLYSCQMSGSVSGEPTVNGSGTNHIHASPTTDWSLQAQHTPRSSQATPNILSAEYNPFAPYHPAVSAAYTHDIYSTQTAEVAILPASPHSLDNASQRSSFSSAPASEIYTQAGSINSYTPSIKMEGEHSDFGTSNETIMMQSPQISHSLLTSTSPYPGTLDATFYHDHSHLGWPKVEYTTSQDLPSISTLPIPLYDRRSESQEHAPVSSLGRRKPSTIARTRSPRKLTTKEDANFQCHVKGCGKLFGRSYNFKAHMETHDSSREYPFPCPLKDCTKKFVRKTDLQRHHQSVHMKQRNHRCDYCSRFFARKDTLRRFVLLCVLFPPAKTS